MRQILIKHEGGVYKLIEGEMVCQHVHVETEPFTVYSPSQEQLDKGTDHDIYLEGLVCLDCGQKIELHD